MGLFDKLFKKESQTPVDNLPIVEDDTIIALGNGEVIDVKTVSDAMFAQEMMGKTCAFKLTDKNVVCPANGTVEVAFPTGHAFGIKMKNGTEILVHIGVDTVSLDGKGFKPLLKVGDEVKAGQAAVQVDWNAIEKAGLDTSTMLIITNSNGLEYNFVEPGNIKSGQKIN